MHGLHLSDKNNLSFKQICDKKGIVIEYDYGSDGSDIDVYNNTLVKKSNDDPGGYWPWKGPNVKMPDYRRTHTVGDTELISTFLQRSKFTDVTWIFLHYNFELIEDVSVGSWFCNVEDVTSYGYHCLPPHKYGPWYIWTAPQSREGLAM